ncbi:MAG: Transcriptional regulator, TrmB [Candidatus Magasanikbacteria bacterium GW2011_GWA2_56_11]|uniref:Transcriptional regulator, TrmB n=1 Tax=Candidatus Magasanikbacteria bacterium GW2011_GWA2_56_11 TaxID=1619044 RepID=A0A0G2AMZ9_9BACT|nr:MAG: Transcriptional regulator, TrmB [Candidatus Magasanikbacteria bacterium GW2011_GWA2_56_11]
MDFELQTIQNLGLDEKQAKVYLAALELGLASVCELAEKSGVKRTSIYNFLEEMKARRLLSEVKKGGKVFFQPGSPELLVSQAKEQLKKVQDSVPFLLGLYNLPANKPKVKFFLGIDGLKNLYEEIWQVGEPIYGYSDYEKMLGGMDQEYVEYMWGFAKRRAALGIPFYSITEDGPYGRLAVARDKEQKRVTKLVKGGAFETEVNIYGKYVAIASFRRPYAGVIIEDVAIAKTMKSIWKMLWDKLE